MHSKCLEDVFSVTIFCVRRCLLDILWDVFKTSSRGFGNKKLYFLKMSSRRLKGQQMFTGKLLKTSKNFFSHFLTRELRSRIIGCQSIKWNYACTLLTNCIYQPVIYGKASQRKYLYTYGQFCSYGETGKLIYTNKMYEKYLWKGDILHKDPDQISLQPVFFTHFFWLLNNRNIERKWLKKF